MKSDHRSKFSNLSNWKEAWKNQGFNGIRTCDLCDVWCFTNCAMKPHIKIEVFIEFISSLAVKWRYELNKLTSLHSPLCRASHRYRGGQGFDSRWSPDFFRLLPNCLNWKFTAMITLHVYLQSQFQHDLSHINFTSVDFTKMAKRSLECHSLFVFKLLWLLRRGFIMNMTNKIIK